MSITVDPLRSYAPDPVPQPGPGSGPDPTPGPTPELMPELMSDLTQGLTPGLRDFPSRPMPSGLSRRARQSALRLRAVHTGMCLMLAVAVGASTAVALSMTEPPEGGWPAPPAPVEPTRQSGTVQVPRTAVGHGANAWVQLQGWCVGDLAFPEDTGRVESCRFLPGAGSIDVAVLDPGRYAPTGHSLVVVVAVGQTAPGGTYRGRLTDDAGTGEMTIGRAAGRPGVVFMWGFTRGGPVAVTVTGPGGSPFASCTDCGGPTR